MAERPIIFSGPMVRAILAGRKTQTRRIVKPQPVWLQAGDGLPACWEWTHRGAHAKDGKHTGCYLSDTDDAGLRALLPQFAPYHAGDALWVRETTIDVERHGYVGPVYVASDEGADVLSWGLRPGPDDPCEVEPHELRCRPPIYLRREHARVFLQVTAVRVEPLQQITEDDARAEGCPDNENEEIRWRPVGWFRTVWDKLNAARGYGWEQNPWVWVIEFTR